MQLLNNIIYEILHAVERNGEAQKVAIVQTASEGEFRLDNFLKNTVKPAPWCGFFVCEISVKKIDRGKNTQYNC